MKSRVVIVYQDNHLLVLDKPAGLLTQPSGTDQDSLEAQGKSWVKEVSNKPGNVYLHAVHRLDRPVSGLVLFARTSKALSRLQESLREKETAKTYLAIVEGALSSLEGKLSHYLVHEEHSTRVVSAQTAKSKLATLTYKVLATQQKTSIVEVQLETGRYHQIRAQFAAIGHPILGDLKYGSRLSFLPGAIALHHWRFQVKHPVSKELTLFEALPYHWEVYTPRS